LTLRRDSKEREEMNELPTKILVATDGSNSAAAAVRRAAGMARAFGAELHVVYVVPVRQPYHLFGAEVESFSLYEEDMQWAQEMLDGQVRKIEESGPKVAKAHLRVGEPDAEVISLGEEIDASMIVVGSRGLGRLIPVQCTSGIIGPCRR
jgi:nucleotide-binding universal stress UspA family protein